MRIATPPQDLTRPSAAETPPGQQQTSRTRPPARPPSRERERQAQSQSRQPPERRAPTYKRGMAPADFRRDKLVELDSKRKRTTPETRKPPEYKWPLPKRRDFVGGDKELLSKAIRTLWSEAIPNMESSNEILSNLGKEPFDRAGIKTPGIVLRTRSTKGGEKFCWLITLLGLVNCLMPDEMPWAKNLIFFHKILQMRAVSCIVEARSPRTNLLRIQHK